MAKNDLLREAIADANAVRDTAIENAKLVLTEQFQPRIQSMLSNALSEMDDEEMYDDIPEDPDAEAAAMADMSEVEGEVPAEEEIPVDDMALDVAPAAPEGDPAAVAAPEVAAVDAAPVDVAPEDSMEDPAEDNLDLEAIIRELEEEMDEDTAPIVSENETEDTVVTEAEEEMTGNDDSTLEEDIDSIINSIISEEEEIDEMNDPAAGENGSGELAEAIAQRDEAYNTVGKLQKVLKEVNLLNAKLLYTNKLFGNFELTNEQKKRVITNFDRAINERETKIVFSTLAESFGKPNKKRAVVKENTNFASSASGTTKPSKEIITESNEQVNRMKKLAGLI